LRSFAVKSPRAFLVSFFVFLVCGQGIAEENSTNLLQRLEKSFSGIQTVQARLRQEKKLKIFDRTIVMTGRLSLENPGKLAWRIDTPIKYALIINGKYALQWDEDSNKVQKIKTAGDPVFKEVISQIEKWFSGEFSSLLKEYDLTVKSTEPPVLEFVPKADGMLSKVIRKLTIRVRADLRYVEQISIEDVGGDLTTISFLDTRLNKPVPASEWEVSPNG
jgi:outer membrane lipoprotein-sorting protein